MYAALLARKAKEKAGGDGGNTETKPGAEEKDNKDSVTKPTEPTKVSDAPISMPPKNAATPSSSTATPTSGAPTVSGKPSPKSFQTKIDFSKYDPNWKNNCDVAVDAETKNPNRDEQQSKSGEKNTKQICFAFRNGICKRQDCKYLHSLGNDVPSTDQPTSKPTAQPQPAASPKIGRVQPMPQSNPPVTSAVTDETRQICQRFQRGFCRFKDCKYLHKEPESSGSGQNAPSQTEPKISKPVPTLVGVTFSSPATISAAPVLVKPAAPAPLLPEHSWTCAQASCKQRNDGWKKLCGGCLSERPDLGRQVGAKTSPLPAKHNPVPEGHQNDTKKNAGKGKANQQNFNHQGVRGPTPSTFGGPQRFPNSTGPQRFPNQSGPQRFPNQSGPQRFPNQSGPQRFPNQSGPQRFPNQSEPQRFHNQSGPQRFPNSSGPQRFPENPKLVSNLMSMAMSDNSGPPRFGPRGVPNHTPRGPGGAPRFPHDNHSGPPSRFPHKGSAPHFPGPPQNQPGPSFANKPKPLMSLPSIKPTTSPLKRTSRVEDEEESRSKLAKRSSSFEDELSTYRVTRNIRGEPDQDVSEVRRHAPEPYQEPPRRSEPGSRRRDNDSRRDTDPRRSPEVRRRRRLSPEESPRKACFNFQKGRCFKGSTCRFEHVYKREICRRFQQGLCSSKVCVYDHVTIDEMEVNIVNYGEPELEEGEEPKPRERKVLLPLDEAEKIKSRVRREEDEAYDDYNRDGEYSADREGSYYRDDPYNRPADEYPQRDRDESSRRRSEEYYPRDEARSRRRDPYEDDIASYRPREERDSRSRGSRGRERSVESKLSYAEEKVMDVTTPLAGIPYKDQVSSKEEEVDILLQELQQEIIEYSPGAESWIKKQQATNDGLIAKREKMKESPVLEGYRNKCEFTVGTNPETRQLAVGFKMDPRSGSGQVGPIYHLKHVPSEMKFIVRHLEACLLSSRVPPYTEGGSEGGWSAATARITQKSESMLIVSYVVQNTPLRKVRELKEELQRYFEKGPGAACKLSSLYFCQKNPGLNGTLDHMYGSERITEVLYGLELTVSPRAYLCINTYGAELLYETISQMLGVSDHTTLVDICCGTGSIGLCLSNWVGQVLGLDVSADSIADARRNALANGLKNTEYRAGSAEENLEGLVAQAKCSQVVAVIDPPRSGLPVKAIRVIRAIAKISRIVFVANDPRLSMKNLVDLTRPTSSMFPGDPFMPVLVNPVDLFPHTSHYYTLLLFQRVPSAQLSVAPPKSSKPAPNLSLPPPGLDSGPRGTPAAAAPPLRPPQDTTGPAFSEAGLSAEQKSWLDQMCKLYGPTFDRPKWVQSFVEQNHQAALKAQEPHLHPPPPVPVAYAPRPQVSGLPPPVQGPRPLQGLPPPVRGPRPLTASLPKPHSAGGGYHSHPPPLLEPPPAPRLSQAEPPEPPTIRQDEQDDIPPMPKFPVAPTNANPKEYAEYKRQYKVYSDWYEQYGTRYKGSASNITRELPDPDKVPPGTKKEAWLKYCEETRDYWQKYDQVRGTLVQEAEHKERGHSQEFDRGSRNEQGGSDIQGRGDDQGFHQGIKNNRGFSQGRRNDQGFDQGRRNDQGFDQGGRNDQGFDQGGRNDQGFDQGGRNNQGFDQGGRNDQGFDQGGRNDRGFDQGRRGNQHFDPSWSNDQGGRSAKGFNQGRRNNQGLGPGWRNDEGFEQGRRNNQGFHQGRKNNQGSGNDFQESGPILFGQSKNRKF